MTSHDLIQLVRDLANALEAAAARADQIEKALRWYAEEDNYFGTYEDETQVPIECPALADKGTRARAALAGVPEPATEEKPEDPARLAAIAACPTPYYHETHRYCPSCPWTEEKP